MGQEKATIKMSESDVEKLTNALELVNENVLLGYAEDGIIDDKEMADILRRLQNVTNQHGIDLDIMGACRSSITNLVFATVDLARHGHIAAKMEGNLCPVTLREVQEAMGYLIRSGQMEVGSPHRTDGQSHNMTVTAAYQKEHDVLGKTQG